MDRISIALIMIFLAASSPGIASAQDDVCMQVFQIAASLVSNKNKGEPEDAMRESMPSLDAAESKPDTPQAFLLIQMHEMLDEVFSGPTPDQFAYAVYRAEKCNRLMKDLPVPPNFEPVRDELEHCSALPQNEKAECSMMLAGAHPSEDEF